HGALGPESIVLAGAADGEPRVGDLLARAAQRATLAVAPATPYDAPERAPTLTATPAEDVFGCGAILFHLLASRAPGPEAAQVPLSELCPDVPMPSVLEDAVRRALSTRPRARPGISELAAAVARAVKDLLGPSTGEGRSTELGRYALVRRLARGGMGEVFLARVSGGTAAARPRVCVVKRIRGEYATDEERVARFVSEARLAARMKHPNVVAVYDLGRTGEDLFIVMEYVAGKNLREVVTRAAERGVAVPVPVALYVAHELVSGLAYVHGFQVPGLAPAGLVHRDVSPQNVLLGYDGAVKLIDFGLARGGLHNPKTAAGIVVGKLAYLSPEQARGHVATPQSDLYAAGLTLWELLCARPLFDGDEPEQVAAAVRDPHPEAPSRMRPDVPAALDHVCLHALQADRAARYPDAAAFAQDLRRLLGDPAGAAAAAGAFLSQLFAAEQQSEQRMARAALEPVGTQPRAVAVAVEARGRSLVHDSDAWVSTDTARTSQQTFDWDALADSLPGPGEELAGSDTAVTEMPPEPPAAHDRTAPFDRPAPGDAPGLAPALGAGVASQGGPALSDSTARLDATLASRGSPALSDSTAPLALGDRTAPGDCTAPLALVDRTAPFQPTQGDRTELRGGLRAAPNWLWVTLAVAVGTVLVALVAFWLLRPGTGPG
ncbi:MAG TPA: serine/threonine-protein kinase, partial [Polyangia bacterium]